ncbi:MAG: NAD(P)/FAD-dependent oxidoreductase [Proteobacteria bacterium]|nr:NAD(P)/FAD-dependent oxidoreductase [Pseudomonadota bacterium]
MSIIQTDVVIVGAGPVGLFAIFQCGMVGLQTHVFEGLSHVGGQCSALYPEKPIFDIPAHPRILGQELADKLFEQAMPFNPTFHFENKLVEVLPIRDEDGYIWHVKSNQGIEIKTKAIIIAAGVGAFGPNRPPMPNLDAFEKTSVHYFIPNKSIYENKNIVIAGGGDSAVDWALTLSSIAKKVTVVHRRDQFRAAPHSEEQLKNLVKQGVVDLCVPYQLFDLKGESSTLTHVVIQNFNDQSFHEIKADYLLPFFGLSTNLGPIAEWGLGISKNSIEVENGTAKTNREGIYAIGDVATYPHKLKLILTGFSEAAFAAHAIYKQIYPNNPLHFEHSTTKGVHLK